MTEAAHADPYTTPSASAVLERALFEVKRVVVGQDAMVERMMIGLLARGHVLLEGVPGVAKTLAVRTLATVVGGDFVRLQFTPDLMPVRHRRHPGLAAVHRDASTSNPDRSSPTSCSPTRSTALPPRCSRRCSRRWPSSRSAIGGQTYRLPDPFLVLATQNPIENDGVYALPEAQRDRFLLKVDVDHADELGELTIVQRMSARPATRAADPDGRRTCVRLQAEAEQVFVHHAVADVRRAARDGDPPPAPVRRAHPRRCARVRRQRSRVARPGRRGPALALLRGRDYVLPGDIADVASDVLAHRLVLDLRRRRRRRRPQDR